MRISNNVMAVLIIVFMLTSIYTNYAILKEGERRLTQVSGRASFGEVRICINHAPDINAIPHLYATVGIPFQYQANATDPDGNDTLTFGTNEVLIYITPGGLIYFTPAFINIGKNYLMTIWVDDNEGCPISSRAYENFYLDIDPPPQNWTNLTPPEGIFEPLNGTLSGTHVNEFSIRFSGITLTYSDVLTCNIKEANGSMLSVSSTGNAIDHGSHSMSYTVINNDSIINDLAVGYIPWILKNCTLKNSGGTQLYSETVNSRIYTHDDVYWADNEITRAVSCQTAPQVYFNNTGKCEFLEDTLFALQMRNGNPVNESCFNNPGVACGDPYCNGLYFPTCDPIDYFGGYSALTDDPNNIGLFTSSVGSYNTQVWYTVYTNATGNFKVRVRQALDDKTFSVAITNLTNVSTSSNVYGGELGGGSLTVADQGDGTWALTHKKLDTGFTGTLDFTFNVSFTNQTLNENRTISIIIAYGTETNAGSPETFEIALDPALGPSNNNESENTSIMIYGPVCSDGENNDFDYLGAGGIWDYSYDCFDIDCNGFAGATQTNELGSGKIGICNYANETNCTDEYDNDYDYILGTDYTDCHDADCFGIDPSCPATETTCNDGINDDWDYTNTESDTADKVGNNGTKYGGSYIYNLTDCEDPDCDGQQGGGVGQLCNWGYETDCSDSFDNDVLQLKDCELGASVGSSTSNPNYDSHAEYDCAGYCRLTGVNNDTETGTECDDGIDNDWDLYKVDNYYDGSVNSTYGAGIDCRWGGYFGYGANYNPDEDCNLTFLSNGKRCELSRELNCTDEYDNDFDGDATTGTAMPHAGWGTDAAGYFAYFGTTYSDDADFDDYDCQNHSLVPTNEALNTTWCFDGIDNDLDGYYWNGAWTANSSTGADCYDPDCLGALNPNNLSQACLSQEYNATNLFFIGLDYPGMYCENGLDEDVDDSLGWPSGGTDCTDPDCNKQFDLCANVSCYDNESIIWDACKDSFDNNYDMPTSQTDCEDSDCAGMIGADSGALCETTETLCYDGFDNDAQGGADCDDHSDCDDEVGGKIDNKDVYCRASESTSTDCFDGFDNDGDGYIDCYDTSCNNQCSLSTITGYSPVAIPNWYGTKSLAGGVTDAYILDYTRIISKDEWYNITFRMTSPSTRAQWTLGAAIGYGQFPVEAFNESTAYLAGPNADNFTLTNTSNGFIMDSNGLNLSNGYTVSFLIRSITTLNATDYELTYAENTGYKTSVDNQIYAEVAEEVLPQAQTIQAIPYNGNLSYGSEVYLRANISDNYQLGLCDWYVYGAATFEPANSTQCRGSFTPTLEGTYYINVTPVDYYSNRGTAISTTLEINLLPSSTSVTIDRSSPFYTTNYTATFNASFNVPVNDSLGTCQVIVKDRHDNETILANITASGSSCYVNNMNISSLSDGLYRIFARATETTESNIVESGTTPLFICDDIRYGICQFVDFDGDDEADVCKVNFPPSITDWYPTVNVTITEEQNQSFNITFEDANGDTIRIRWFVDGSLVKVHYNDSLRSNYTFIGDYLSAGARNITVTIDDSEYFISQEWLLNVTNINRLPYFTQIIPNVTWDEDTSLSAFDLDDYIYDPDSDDDLTFSYEYIEVVHSPIRVTIDNTTHRATFSQPANWYGNDTIYFTVDDGRGGTNRSNDIYLVVTNVPEPPPPPPPVSIGPQRCKSQWFCRPWGVCYPNSTRYRACIDVKECPFPTNKPIMKERCTYIPTCHDGYQNQNEDDIDCGGPCPPCWTCFDMIQNCHIVKRKVVCEEGIDCGGPCPACASCFDGIQNQDEVGTDCGGICEVDCCENSYRDINLGEVGVDCGGPCPECPIVKPAPTPLRRLRQILFWLLLLLLIIVLITMALKNKERIAEAVYKFKLKKEVVPEEDIRGIMLNKLVSLERTIPRKTREELTKDISNSFKELVKTTLKVDYEFTHEELVKELGKSDIQRELKKIMMSFSEDMSKVKYSGYKLTKDESRSLLSEMKIMTKLLTKKVEKESPEKGSEEKKEKK
ncbi:hypothetical protein KY360_05605 [Candidatus Woesearchaeota archaeon]|nr:hypothetical protein [Candidatus Woesearchaeota archaeon]